MLAPVVPGRGVVGHYIDRCITQTALYSRLSPKQSSYRQEYHYLMYISVDSVATIYAPIIIRSLCREGQYNFGELFQFQYVLELYLSSCRNNSCTSSTDDLYQSIWWRVKGPGYSATLRALCVLPKVSESR